MLKKPTLGVLAACLMFSGSLGAQPTPLSPESQVKVVIVAIQQNRETVKEAWDKGELNADLTLTALGSWELVNAGIAMPSGNMKLSRNLSRELLERHPEVLNNAETLSNRALLQIGNYLGSLKDARCVALYEALLARKPQHAPVWDDEVDGAIYNLASYYESTHQDEKALEAQLKIFDLSSSSDLLSNYVPQIGWTFERLKDPQRTEKWYESLEIYPDARVMATERLMRADQLFRQHKTAAGRALLLQPVTAPHGETVKEMLMFSLAQSFISEGDLASAQKYLNQGLDQWELLREKPSSGPYLEYHQAAQQLAERIDAQLNKPFFWQDEELRLWASPGQGTQFHRLVLRFKTAPKQDVSFTCDLPDVHLEAVVADKDALVRVVFLSLDSPTKSGDFHTFVVAHSPDFPGQEARLPLNIHVFSPTEMQAAPNDEN